MSRGPADPSPEPDPVPPPGRDPTPGSVPDPASAAAPLPTARLPFLLRYARPVAAGLAVLALCDVAERLLALAVPWMQKDIFDAVVAHRGRGAAELFGAWAAVALAGQAAAAAAGLLGTRLQQRMANAAREDAYRHVFRLPAAVLAARGDSQVLADVEYAAGGTEVLVAGLGWTVGLATGIVGGFAALASLSPAVVLGILPLTVAYAVVPRLLARWIRRAERREQDARIAARAVALDHLAAATDVRVFGAAEWCLWQAKRRWSNLLRASWLAQIAHQGSYAANWALQTAYYLVAWLVAVREVHTGTLTVGGLLAVTLYLGMLFGPLDRVLSFQYHWVGWMLDIDRALELFRLPADGGFGPGASQPTGEPRFDLKAVEVRYPGQDRPALTVDRWTLRPGEAVALVGPNGSGKSTLLRLLLGLVRPTRGRVLAAGADLAAVEDAWLRAHVAAMPPEPSILRLSLADNLRLAAPAATDVDLSAALEAVGLGPWAATLPRGLETPLGPDSVVPSSGQRQRLGLARLLLRRPRVLVLDEPTSALEPGSADLVWRLLRPSPHTALVFATHDSALAARADRVAVFADGRMEEGSADPAGSS